MRKSSIDQDILYEDNHLIIVNKRPSDIVQGDKTGDEPLSDILKSYLKKKFNKPGEVFLGVVHRLDRPVSGVVIFARTSKAEHHAAGWRNQQDLLGCCEECAA
jgi:23S rRNA pseudouridine1911/1915/1917 synthase